MYAIEMVKKPGKAILLGDELLMLSLPRITTYEKFREALEEIHFSKMETLLFSV